MSSTRRHFLRYMAASKPGTTAALHVAVRATASLDRDSILMDVGPTRATSNGTVVPDYELLQSLGAALSRGFTTSVYCSLSLRKPPLSKCLFDERPKGESRYEFQ